ncbi:MAG: hypothetical protein PSX81_09375 [bacterium]|nr:hypothetical protein [bacterium]
MIKSLFLLIVAGILVLTSCNKKDDGTRTKIGFYFSDTTSKSTEPQSLNLFIDNAFKGKINRLNYEAHCGDSMLLYVTIDSKRHEVDVKNDAGEFINSEYVQIGKNKSSSGSGKNSDKVIEGVHGSSFSKLTGDDCATMSFMR